MLEILWQLAIFFLGINIGKSRAENIDVINKIKYMESLLNLAYEERDQYKMAAMASAQKAESWERRYISLKDEKIGS